MFSWGNLLRRLRLFRRRSDRRADLAELEKFIQAQESPPKPPWIQYPGNPPFWGGWRQGVSEAWLLHVWFPFWEKLTPEEKDAYLVRYPPPDDDWALYMATYWR